VPFLGGMLYIKTQSELLKKLKLNLGKVAHIKNDRAQTDHNEQNALLKQSDYNESRFLSHRHVELDRKKGSSDTNHYSKQCPSM
jgi:hypothetical protein